jgi:hypothetical protein
MYLFAHIFSGALIGLIFWSFLHDRRAVPVCILGAVLPDLLDKPLAFLFPRIFGASRTIGHSLFFFATVLAAGLILWYSRHTLLGVALACGIISHQFFDLMWNLVGSWYFPLLGLFPVILIPDYVRSSLWLELTSPSELVFLLASAVLIAAWYPEFSGICMPCRSIPGKRILEALMACMLAGMGLYLVIAGLTLLPGTVFALAYSPFTSLMAGVTALCGAVVFARTAVSTGSFVH